MKIFCIVFHINKAANEIVQRIRLIRSSVKDQILGVIEVYRKGFVV